MLLIFLLMYIFHYRYLDVHKNTTWVSEDHMIYIEVDSNGSICCTINSENQKILCVAIKDDGHINNDLILYPYEYIYDKGLYSPNEQPQSYTPYEHWDFKFHEKIRILDYSKTNNLF